MLAHDNNTHLLLLPLTLSLSLPCRYDEFVFEMFYDEFVELLVALVPGQGQRGEGRSPVTAASLLELFTGEQQQQADCFTWYMRLLTAGNELTARAQKSRGDEL